MLPPKNRDRFRRRPHFVYDSNREILIFNSHSMDHQNMGG